MTPSLRYASLSGYVDLAHELGLEPGPLMTRVGLDPSGLAVPDRWIPATAVSQLLELSAEESGHDDFGLRLASYRQLSTLGPLSLALAQESSLRDALGLLLRYEHTYNESIRMRLTEDGGLATIRLWFELGEPLATTQAEDLAVGALRGIIGDLIGRPWEPLSVCFTHDAPADPSAYVERLGGRVHFGHDFTGLVMYARDLDSGGPEGRPTRADSAAMIRSLTGQRRASVADRVKELVEVLLATERCSAEEVARSLQVDRRTLHRHLDAEGTTFTAILDQTRAGLAERYLANARYPMTEISQLLGFAAPSAFTRWFRRHFEDSPTEWRRRRAQAQLRGRTPGP
ncbi:MAG TPA: AraC family transcriptional regulator [Nocardioides sp.]|nr:AraC family transcriptional regulator [Nocardioides sp.]